MQTFPSSLCANSNKHVFFSPFFERADLWQRMTRGGVYQLISVNCWREKIKTLAWIHFFVQVPIYGVLMRGRRGSRRR